MTVLLEILLVERNTAMALSIAVQDYVLETGHIELEGRAGELAATSTCAARASARHDRRPAALAKESWPLASRRHAPC